MPRNDGDQKDGALTFVSNSSSEHGVGVFDAVQFGVHGAVSVGETLESEAGQEVQVSRH